MRIRVLHNPRFLDFYGPGQPLEKLPPIQELQAVAELEVKELDEAYAKTNTIDRVWWENAGVVKLFEAEGCRSTSVGDVLLNLDTHACHVVAHFGFEELPASWGAGLVTEIESLDQEAYARGTYTRCPDETARAIYAHFDERQEYAFFGRRADTLYIVR